MIYIRKGEAVSPLLLNRFGHSDMLGLSTARDLSISAIISGIFFVEQIVKIQNIRQNIRHSSFFMVFETFFDSKSMDFKVESHQKT